MLGRREAASHHRGPLLRLLGSGLSRTSKCPLKLLLIRVCRARLVFALCRDRRCVRLTSSLHGRLTLCVVCRVRRRIL
eukprot:7199258-Prymnesium_polylepis.1